MNIEEQKVIWPEVASVIKQQEQLTHQISHSTKLNCNQLLALTRTVNQTETKVNNFDFKLTNAFKEYDALVMANFSWFSVGLNKTLEAYDVSLKKKFADLEKDLNMKV